MWQQVYNGFMGEWITIAQACKMLDVSRPTLNKLRQQHKLKELVMGGKCKLSKLDIISKLIVPQPNASAPCRLTVHSFFDLQQLQILSGVFDLRSVQSADAYGVMRLVNAIQLYCRENSSDKAHLLFEHGSLCDYLEAICFFREVHRGHQGQLLIHGPKVKPSSPDEWSILQPLHLVGYRGGERKQITNLIDELSQLGFSEECCGHVGWIAGELCDNANIHSTQACRIAVEGLPFFDQSTHTRNLLIVVGDSGIGLVESLRKNKKYQSKTTPYLVLQAFKDNVTSRSEKRGKGLTDVLALVKKKKSVLHLNSQGFDVLFDFTKNKARIDVQNKSAPIASHMGTSLAVVLPDTPIEAISKKDRYTNDNMIADYQKNLTKHTR